MVQATILSLRRPKGFVGCTRHHHLNHFSTTPCLSMMPKNRIWPARVRNEADLDTLILSSASSRVPLLTLWMTTWDGESRDVSARLRVLIAEDGIGESEGGVSFVEVEMDAPELDGGGVSGIAQQRYMINSLPTLMAFDRSEPQIETKVSRVADLRDAAFLTKWVTTEAARQGSGGAGGRLWGVFGR